MMTAVFRCLARRGPLVVVGLSLFGAPPVFAQGWKDRGGRYPTKPAVLEYIDEHSPSYDPKNNVFWFAPEAIAPFKVTFKVENGELVCYTSFGKKVQTAERVDPVTYKVINPAPDYALFVMDADGDFYFIKQDWINWTDPSGAPKLHHTSIPGGKPVAAAGKIQVENGIIKYLDNESGHYEPENRMLVEAINSLERQGLSKAALKGKVKFFSQDDPGAMYAALDPQGKEKAGKYRWRLEEPGGAPRPAEEVRPPAPDDRGLLEPEEQVQRPQLDVERLGQLRRKYEGTFGAAAPVEPPSKAVSDQIKTLIGTTAVNDMTIGWMRSLYQLHPAAAKVVGQLMAEPKMEAKNSRMGVLRKQMDLMVWKEILKQHNIRVEVTNQGKSNGIKSDLDYTLYFVAEEGGVSVADLIKEHTATWKGLHQLEPDAVEIKVMNGDQFYPDWRNEALSEWDHRADIKRLLGELRQDKEAYSVPGATKQQTHNRALREGWTELMGYNPDRDRPEVPIEDQVIYGAGEAREVAARYRGTHPQYNHMNALGNLVQNMGEYLHHTGDGAQDLIRRAKYGNRIINEGLGHLRFFANSYQQIYESTLPQERKDALLRDYLRKTFGALSDDNGRPMLDGATIETFKKVIDIQMQIEMDKTKPAKTDERSFAEKQAEYFKEYRPEAEARVTREMENQAVSPDLRARLVLAEQQYLFELQQRRMLAEATLAGLRESVRRDLTAEGVLRNRVRFDPATQKFVVEDLAGARKVAFERAVEVALFYELVNGLPDRDLRLDLKKRALATAPDVEIADLYGSLDQVNRAEIDRFVAGNPESKVQRKIDDLIRKQQMRALELALEKKERVVEAVKARGVVVDPAGVPPDQVRDEIIEGRLWGVSPERRAQFTELYQALGERVSGDFKEAFHQNASALMMGSSAVNLIRAWQDGGVAALPRATFSEAIWYMPSYVSTPFLVVDLLAKAREGRYGEAAWGTGLFGAMAVVPGLGHVMLAYNLGSGSLDIVHTHVVTRMDKDLTEQALKSRPRDEDGGPLRDGLRARASRWPDAKESVYHGSPPGFPLFYGRYRNEEAIGPATVVDGVKYSDGTVPHDNLADRDLADTAAAEFAPQIDSILTASGLEPGTPQWAQRAWELKLKFGFEIPFYRRIAKVYQDKYQYLTYVENSPSAYNPEYLSACRLDVYDWYVQQPPGYKLELQGDAAFWFGDQTDKMQEMIARECALVMGRQHEAANRSREVSEANLKAFKDIMARSFSAERGLLAAKQALRQRIQSGEEKAAAALEQQAIELANQHQTYFGIHYPFTWADQELPPNLQFAVRTVPAKVKQPVGITVDEEITALREGAPGGWQPGKDYADKFKADSSGWQELRPVTASVRFTAHLLDADSNEVTAATLDLPVVLYEPSVSGSITVTVFGLAENGDSSYYNGALVTLNRETKETGPIYGSTSFGRLKPGSYSITVAPRQGDARHGQGNGSAVIVDELLSNDRKGSDRAAIVVRLPYIPEKKIADKPEEKPGHVGPGGDKPGGKRPGGGADSTGAKAAGKDSTGVGRGGADSTAAAGGRTVEEIIRGLVPLTSQAEKARDDAKAACNFPSAAAAQEQLVAVARNFVASAFPKGAPAEVERLADGFDAELTALKRTANAQEEANAHLRKGRALLADRHAEPVLAELEAAAKVPDIPQCLYDQVMALYNEIKADLEKRMKLIDQAVDAANTKCDYAAAQRFGEQVEAEDSRLSWVVTELPRIKDLNRRQQSARNLAGQAESKAQEADQAAAAGSKDRAIALYDEALQLARQALAAAPPCEAENLKSLLDLPARKEAVNRPRVDQSLVLLLDTSGSMGDNNKMENAKQAATDAVKSLGPTTEIALISYDGGCGGGWRIVQPFTTDHQGLISAIASLRPGGGTPTAPAVGFAQAYLEKSARSGSGQIMLMTDGQNDCGSMVDAGAALRRSSIPVRLDAVGFGLGDNSTAQSDLGALVRASGGGGQTYSANSARELIAAFRRAFIANQIRPRDPFVTGEAGTRLAALFAAAVEFLKQSDIRGAMDQFKSAADQFPTSPAAAFNASLAFEAGGQPLQAMNYAKQYLQLAPNAFDASQVQGRIAMLEKEQAANPRAIYTPADCAVLYRWAQRESRTGMDAARRAQVLDIMTTAQRGDCAAAQEAYTRYVQQYGKKP